MTALLGALVVGGAAAFVYSGSYNVGADEPHHAWVLSALKTLREQSIRAQAAGLTLPDLTERTRVVRGAGNYAAMCAGCHLAPGVQQSELSTGLYPHPPNLTRATTDSAEAFWVIKHGIKASGMAAWGKSMDDDSIWSVTAFLKVLPTLDAAAYDQLVASSGGHSHGSGAGGEHDGHHSDGAPPAQGSEHPLESTEPGATASKSAHRHKHADGHHHVQPHK